VCVEWEWPGVPSIQFDRQNAAYQATHHLVMTGHQHIAYIGPEDKRLLGYHQALWEAGLTADEALVQYAADALFGSECCERILRTGQQIDAICGGTDEVSLGVLHCLYRHGLRVPHDLAIASIDNLDISAFTIPALTTVDVPKRDIGLHAIEILTLETPRRGAGAYAVTVPTQLIVRESSPLR